MALPGSSNRAKGEVNMNSLSFLLAVISYSFLEYPGLASAYSSCVGGGRSIGTKKQIQPFPAPWSRALFTERSMLGVSNPRPSAFLIFSSCESGENSTEYETRERCAMAKNSSFAGVNVSKMSWFLTPSLLRLLEEPLGMALPVLAQVTDHEGRRLQVLLDVVGFPRHLFR